MKPWLGAFVARVAALSAVLVLSEVDRGELPLRGLCGGGPWSFRFEFTTGTRKLLLISLVAALGA